MSESPRGSALISVLLGLFLLEIAIAGLIYVCTQEAVIARAFGERLRLRAAAESGIDAALGAWPADSLRMLPPGGRHQPVAAAGSLHGGARHTAEIERLHGGWYVVRGVGSAPMGPASAQAAALVSMFETEPFWRDFAAAVSSGGPVAVLAGAVLDGTAPDAAPPPWNSTVCPAQRMADMIAALNAPQRPALLVARLADAAPDPAAVLRGAPALAQDSTLAPAAFDTVGPLPLAHIAVLADRIESGTISLNPAVQAGQCDEAAPGNWGAPFDPAHACADYVPLVFAPGDLELIAGEGQALLVVTGHIRLHPGVRLSGAILALGGMTAQSADLLGSVRLGPSASVLGGTIVYNACALWRAFTRPAALRLPTRRNDHWWLPVF